MSLANYSSTEAIDNQRSNKYALWSPRINNEYSAQSRLSNSEYFIPDLSPSFTINKEDRIFTMGSCFARNIEVLLEKFGYTVTSHDDIFEKYEPRDLNGHRPAYNFLNRFNSFAIMQDLTWALDPEEQFDDNSLVPFSNGTFADPHSHFTLSFVGKKETLERRKELNEVNRRISSSRIIILTLGLSEAWKDNLTNRYINYTPTKEMFEENPERFSFHVTSYEENLASLEKIYSLLQGYGHKDFQLVFTVSPVTLAGTFRSNDVIISNCYSKSVLRAAVEAIQLKHKNVHYFPSYEMVMYSDSQVAWRDDKRHPSGHIVRKITELFLNTHTQK